MEIEQIKFIVNDGQKINVVACDIPNSLYSLKATYDMKPECIVVHNTYNDVSAKSEVSYMSRNSLSTSFHYAVDDIEIIRAIPPNRNAWHAGDGVSGKGNRTGLSIEVCYSKSGGSRFKKAEKNASIFIATILFVKGWGLDRVKKHQDFSGKYCPHRTLDLGWDRFLKMIENELNNLKRIDNKISNWAQEAAKWAVENKITDGKDPKKSLSREEAWTMLYRYDQMQKGGKK